MNDTMSSPPRNKAANNRKTIGCVITFVVLLVGVGVALVVWGPRLFDGLVGRTATVSLELDDDTSPAKLAAHRERAIAQLNGYGWVDKEAGVAHIPIDRAIAVIAENGLPVGTEAAETTGQEEEQPAAGASAEPPVDLTNVSFSEDVLPIFMEHCSECHGSEDPEENLELTRYRTIMVGSQNGPVIEPGDPDNSYLVEMIVRGRMPKEGDPLSPAEIATIIAWIEAGAPEN